MQHTARFSKERAAHILERSLRTVVFVTLAVYVHVPAQLHAAGHAPRRVMSAACCYGELRLTNFDLCQQQHLDG
jgi:hypothetical protein